MIGLGSYMVRVKLWKAGLRRGQSSFVYSLALSRFVLDSTLVEYLSLGTRGGVFGVL